MVVYSCVNYGDNVLSQEKQVETTQRRSSGFAGIGSAYRITIEVTRYMLKLRC
ncbi:hypothetical protein HanRHA438_Chr07g0316971 [Helianthus annuus]|nr:hypothetical protein HanRHA438_Chr07g0316971 [Helianthus annuus]